MKKLAILGSTGSIGRSTLNVVRYNREIFKVVALIAGENIKEMVKQCLYFSPQYVIMKNIKAAKSLKQALQSYNTKIEITYGEEAASNIVSSAEVDQVVSAISGTAGLSSTLAAIYSGKTILLANKESLVTCGNLFMEAAKISGAKVFPIDSEHNAIFQALPKNLQENLSAIDLKKNYISSIVLTGSGGPFHKLELSQLKNIHPNQACKHPNWDMGRKISVDSATMMNKGLEYIEARRLFNASHSQIEILIHPQSVIHSMVRYSDGSIQAHLSPPDMKVAISYVMAWPKRIYSGVKRLDFCALGNLNFYKPNYNKYPCLKLAIDSFRQGQAAVISLNVANEISVAAFLDSKINFRDISVFNLSILETVSFPNPKNIEEVINLDTRVRLIAEKQLKNFIK